MPAGDDKGMEGLLDRFHGGMVHQRRVRVLSRYLAELAPQHARVLDVGCGDGRVGALIQEQRPDLEVTGLDIAARRDAYIPVTEFDGKSIPLEDGSADVVMLVDVLHHADDPMALLREAKRVSSRGLILKDVTTVGPLDDATLRFMDWVGNARHGVPLPYNFWSQAQWRQAFADLGIAVAAVERRLGIYPRPWGVAFERRMHFIVRLVPEQEAVG
jgi:SAM-dependent methyltransferase